MGPRSETLKIKAKKKLKHGGYWSLGTFIAHLYSRLKENTIDSPYVHYLLWVGPIKEFMPAIGAILEYRFHTLRSQRSA
jgi:hypothetical protein